MSPIGCRGRGTLVVRITCILVIFGQNGVIFGAVCTWDVVHESVSGCMGIGRVKGDAFATIGGVCHGRRCLSLLSMAVYQIDRVEFT